MRTRPAGGGGGAGGGRRRGGGRGGGGRGIQAKGCFISLYRLNMLLSMYYLQKK